MWVLGGSPGSKNSGIPGNRVGYMPQEISLVGEFTRNDTFYYFGRINGLDDVEIGRRARWGVPVGHLRQNNRDLLVTFCRGEPEVLLGIAAVTSAESPGEEYERWPAEEDVLRRRFSSQA